MKKSKIPKDIVEFGNALQYPTVYGYLIAQTVAIYQSKIRAIKKSLKENKKTRIPRHPRTLLREAFSTTKNKQSFDEKYLLESGIPSVLGIQKSIEMIEKDDGKSALARKAHLGPMLYGIAVGDYIDCEYQKLLDMKGGAGSQNKQHSCIDKRELKRQLKSIREAMDRVFACDTAYGDCNNNSMASGHCMLSSLVLQDMYGGSIKGGEVNGIPHYWNTFCEHDVDLTGDQFKKPPIQVKKGELYRDGYIFKRSPFESMNQDFNREVWSKHCKFRKRVIKELKDIDRELYNKLQTATTLLS